MGHTYTYTSPLKVTNIIYAFGPEGGGQAVVVIGDGFVSGASVLIGGNGATSVVVANSTTIYCTTPSGSGLSDVTVLNPDATTGTLVDGYLYQAAPGEFVVNGLPSVRRDPSIRISQNLSQAAVCTFTSETEPLGEQDVQLQAASTLIFAGVVQDKVQRYEERTDQIVWDATLLDYSAYLNRRRPFGVYDTLSVTTIVSRVMAAYAPEFTVHVEASMPVASIILNGALDFVGVLNALAALAGGAHWYLEGFDLYFFLSDPLHNNPALIDESNQDLLHDPDVRFEKDYRSIRNRVFVIGAGGLVVQVDDTTSQGLYGVREFTVTDTSITTSTGLTSRGALELVNFANPIPTVTYSTRDMNTTVGKFVTFNLVDPPVVGTFLIQTVTIDQVHEADGLKPRYTVMASPVRFTFRDLMSHAVIATQEQTPPGLGGDVTSTPGGSLTIPPASVTADKLAGCIPGTALLPSGVTPGSYGVAASVARVTVNAAGQITVASEVPIAIVQSQVTGLPAALALLPTSGQKDALVGTAGAPGTANKYVTNSDSRLTDARTPAAHHTTHEHSGSDAIKLDDLETPDDNTDLNVSITHHGLTPKLPNDATKFLDGTGAYTTPAGSGGGTGSAWSVLTNGDAVSPSVMFDSFGDVVMAEILR